MSGDDAGGGRDRGGRPSDARDRRREDRGLPSGEASRRRPATAQERDRPPGDGERRGGRRPRRHGRGAEGEDPRKRGPERLGGFLGALLEKWGLDDDVERASAVADWDEIVGEDLAGRTRPAGIRGETLFVEVESASWMQELNMMRHQILRRLNAGREKGRVENIVFLQAGRSEEPGSSKPGKGRR